MKVFEQIVDVGTGETVDRLDGGAGLIRAIERPGREDRGGEFRKRAAGRLGEVLTRGLVLPLLESAYAQHQPREAVALVDLHDPVGELGSFVGVSVRYHR